MVAALSSQPKLTAVEGSLAVQERRDCYERALSPGTVNPYTNYTDLISRMQMEDFVYDFPLTVDFEKREHVSESIPAPIFEFEPDCGDGLDDVDVCDPSL